MEMESNKRLSLKLALERLNSKKQNVILQGKLVSPKSDVSMIDVKSDIDGFYININGTEEEPVGLWMWEDKQFYYIEFSSQSEDFKYASQLVGKYLNCSIEISEVQGMSKLFLSSNANKFILYGWNSNEVYLKITIVEYFMHISSSKDKMVVTYNVLDANNNWHKIISVRASTTKIAPDVNSYNWTNNEGTIWRMISDYKLTCNGRLIALHHIPFVKGEHKYVLHGFLRPIKEKFKYFRVQVEIDILQIRLEELNNITRGFWLKNVAADNIFYKLDGQSAADYKQIMNQCNNILMLYDSLKMSRCEKNDNGKYKVNRTIQQLQEDSYESFDIQYIHEQKEFILSALNDVIDVRLSHLLTNSIGVQSKKLDSLGKRPREIIDLDDVNESEKVPKLVTPHSYGLRESTIQTVEVSEKFSTLDSQFEIFTDVLTNGENERRELMKQWWDEVLKILNEQYNGSTQVDALLLGLVLRKFQSHSNYTRIVRSNVLMSNGEPSNLKLAFCRWHIYAYNANFLRQIEDLSYQRPKKYSAQVVDDYVEEEVKKDTPKTFTDLLHSYESVGLSVDRVTGMDMKLVEAKLNALDSQFVCFLHPLMKGDNSRREVMNQWWNDVLKILNEYNDSPDVDALLLKLVLSKLNNYSDYSQQVFNSLVSKGLPSKLRFAYKCWYGFTYSLDLKNGGKKSYKQSLCSVCNEFGHTLSQCIVKRTRNLICKMTGRNYKEKDNYWCINCDTSGHYASVCTATQRICSQCKMTGHIVLYCSEMQKLIFNEKPGIMEAHVRKYLSSRL